MAAELPKDQVKSIYVSETFAKNPENAAILAEYPGYELVSDSVFQGRAVKVSQRNSNGKEEKKGPLEKFQNR